MSLAPSEPKIPASNPFLRAKLDRQGVSGNTYPAYAAPVPGLANKRPYQNRELDELFAGLPQRPLDFPFRKKANRKQRFLGWALLLFLAAAIVFGPTPVANRIGKPIIAQVNALIHPAPPPKPLAIKPVVHAFVSSKFGRRWGRMHQGVDYAAVYGEPIYAMSAGIVVYSGWQPGYGRTVVLDHGNGMTTRYGHCSKLLVSAGQAVTQETVIAKVGSTGHSTGPHLHFEVMKNGVHQDPLAYLAAHQVKTPEKKAAFQLAGALRFIPTFAQTLRLSKPTAAQ